MISIANDDGVLNATEKTNAANPKRNYARCIIGIGVVFLVLWLLGFGFLINDAVNKGSISDEKNYACEKSNDCAEKSACDAALKSIWGVPTNICVNRNYEPRCIVPKSPLIEDIEPTIPRTEFDKDPTSYRSGCFCSSNKCAYLRYNANISIEKVWNNDGKISIMIHREIDNLKDRVEVRDMATGRRDDLNSRSCVPDLTERGGFLCQIDTYLDFPKIPGKDGAVKIGLYVPNYYTYNCEISSVGENKTC